MTNPVTTIVVPIGPTEYHTRWLPQCLDSIASQTVKTQVLLIDDAPQLGRHNELVSLTSLHLVGVEHLLHTNPWPLRDGGSVNVGAGMCPTPFFFFLSCDDWLDAHCIEKCLEEHERVQDAKGFYWPSLDYVHVADGNRAELVRLPTIHAMISVALWKEIGGIPPQGGLGHCDTFVMNVLLTHYKDRFHAVDNYNGLYKHRQYADQTNNKDRDYIYPIEIARTIYLNAWKPMGWVGA